ncbi:hypothetical protein EIP75_20445 [Aquabacterium soli]|uniref:Uncharacterized protein n=1 Tax=Aquabacterium soli TaxID=2493092 RepID=A0A3R8U137_9BURK|nr:hypothetical protein [Aquabacterium soli]RRS02442.1 hypothetical protein EIP75_20445 [Aquabacterium soli]
MSALHKSKIYTRYHPLKHIAVQDVREMFKVFCRYYENTSLEQFISDLNRKSGAFIIRRKIDDAIVGFSTMGIYHMEVDGKKIRGIFSGDTILEKEYWGNRAMNAAFVKRLVWEAIKDPFTPQYWFLISKGYKTFLLLTRNFPDYYPHPEHDNPHMKHIVEAYCDKLFPGKLDRDAMVLDFGEGSNCLKSDVTPISAAQRTETDIAFFEQRNPQWERGTELPCVGRADLVTFFQVIAPQVLKLLFKPSRSGAGWRRRLANQWSDSSFGKAVARHRATMG